MMHAHNDIGRLSGKGEYAARRGGPMTLGTVMRWALQRGSINSSLIGALRFWQSVKALQPRLDFERAGTDAESRALPTEKYVARLKSFVGICRAFGITPVLMTQPVINIRTALTPDWTDPRNQEIFNHLIREVGAEEDVLVIDLVNFFFHEVEKWNEPMVVFYDGVHFTDYGSKRAAEHITERLYEAVLQGRLAGSEEGSRSPS
jgi:lysophospholipase L1-like esterase